ADLPPVDQPIEVDSAAFDEIVRAARVPVLVDFCAAWCGPWRMAPPEVEGLAHDLAGQAIVLKVDTDRHSDLAGRFQVQGIPNFVVLRNGEVVFQRAGVAPRAEMRRWIEAAVTVKA